MRGKASCFAVPLMAGVFLASASLARDSGPVCRDHNPNSHMGISSGCAALSSAWLHCESLLVRIEQEWGENSELLFEEAAEHPTIASNSWSGISYSDEDKLADMTDYILTCQRR